MALRERVASPTTPRAHRPWVLPLSAVALLAALAALALLPLRGPAPAGPRAPADEFSAGRARAHIDQIARQPRPSGSAAHTAVREYLVAQLRAAGLQPEVQRATAAQSFADRTAVAGRVHNVRATIPGSGGDLRVLIVAHYDSVGLGPGATDDGMGVATILELARVLPAAGPPRNTVELLLTDAEEPGSIGAQAYVESPAAGDPERTVVLNLEARGTRGRVVMFETGAGDSAYLGALRGHTPFATSVSDEIYRLLPNDTDFTVFRQAGFTGMNFAVVGDSARYDTELDDLDHQGLGTLQDMGSTVLAAARSLAGGEPDLADAGEDTFFTAYGLLVSYPAGWGLGLAVVAALAVAGALWAARPRGALRTALTLPVPLLGAAVLSRLVWQALLLVRPHYAGFLFGDPYRPGPAIAGILVLTLACCLTWAALLRRRVDATGIAAGVLCWLAALSVLTAVLVPGAAYLFGWPALAGAAGLAVSTRLPGGSPWRPLLASAAAVPAVVLLTPLTAILFPTAGLAFAAAPVILVALLLFTAVPLVRARLPVIAGVALTGVLLVGAGAALDGPDSRHPAQAGLYLVKDADSGREMWLSDVDSGQDWVLEHTPEERTAVEETFPVLDWPDGYRHGPATGGTPPIPQATIAGQRRDGDVREVRLRITVDRPAFAVSLFADQRPAGIVGATVDGKSIRGGHTRQTSTPWTWGVHFVAPGDGFDVILRVRGDQPVPLRLLAYAGEIPDAALRSPRPDDVSWSAGGFGQYIGAKAAQA